MKRAIFPFFLLAALPGFSVVSLLEAQVPNAAEGAPGTDGYRLNTTRVQQMGMGDLNMVMYDDPHEVTVFTYGGNVAGLVWGEPFSSLEGNFSYGSGSYTSEYGDENSWSYMGNGFPIYKGMPILEPMYSVYSPGAAFPAPGGVLSLKRQSMAFFLSGAYARDTQKSHYEDEYYEYTYETSQSSPQVGIGVSVLTTPEFSYGLALDYAPIKETYSSSGGSSDEENHSRFSGQIGLCRRGKSSGSFQTTTGGEFQYTAVNLYDDNVNFWSIGVEHVGGFSVGYGAVRARVGRLEEMTDIEVGGRLLFAVPQSPLLFSIGFNRVSLSEEDFSPTQTTLSAGVGFSTPVYYAGAEYVNDSFDEATVTKIETLRFGGELRSMQPLFIRAGYKTVTAKGMWSLNMDEDVLTGGIGLYLLPQHMSVDVAYNNSRETYMATYDDGERVTDHIFGLSLKKAF